MKSSKERHRHYALLDRDGTIIVDKAYLSNPDEIEFTAGALEGLKLLRDNGFGLVVITNQSGIARGYFDEKTLQQIHTRLREMLSDEGLVLDAIYHCPHGPGEDCRCRKPAPGMIFKAMADFGFDPRSAIFIGDGEADMAAAAASGVKGIRIGPADQQTHLDTLTAGDFPAAARQALSYFREAAGRQSCT